MPGVLSCFLYTTQGDAEHAELQENIYEEEKTFDSRTNALKN